MDRLTHNFDGNNEMICRNEDCYTDEEICPLFNVKSCPCLQDVFDRLKLYEDFFELLFNIMRG